MIILITTTVLMAWESCQIVNSMPLAKVIWVLTMALWLVMVGKHIINWLSQSQSISNVVEKAWFNDHRGMKVISIRILLNTIITSIAIIFVKPEVKQFLLCNLLIGLSSGWIVILQAKKLNFGHKHILFLWCTYGLICFMGTLIWLTMSDPSAWSCLETVSWFHMVFFFKKHLGNQRIKFILTGMLLTLTLRESWNRMTDPKEFLTKPDLLLMGLWNSFLVSYEAQQLYAEIKHQQSATSQIIPFNIQNQPKPYQSMVKAPKPVLNAQKYPTTVS